jgi:mediator of RNA polymerase II transcription subunit 16
MIASFRNAGNLTEESFHLHAKLVSLIEESPVRVDAYERLLANIDSIVKHGYQTAGFSTADRATPEREMLINGAIPPVLQPAVTSILCNTMPLIRPGVDRLRLFVADYSWLGISDDDMTEKFRKSYDVDIVKRTVVPAKNGVSGKAMQPKRRCVRCCSVSEDVNAPRSVPALRMLAKTAILRSCPCGGSWALEK